jgi:hypothetical protein
MLQVFLLVRCDAGELSLPLERAFQRNACLERFAMMRGIPYCGPLSVMYFDDFFRINGRTQQFPGYCTDVWFEQAKKWIRECHRRGKAFFAYVSTNAPHGPFYAPERYKTPYAELDKDTRGFFAMIANLDENIAKLDGLLAELGL